jgi:hypothetical protein
VSNLFVKALQTLWHHAGEPPTRVIAACIGPSHSTVNDALRGHRVPSWDACRQIIEYLSGNPDEFLPLWQDVAPRRVRSTNRVLTKYEHAQRQVILAAADVATLHGEATLAIDLQTFAVSLMLPK